MNFDKVSFANLLRRAKGERSINRFGVEAGVDPGYISRLLRGLIRTAPSAAIINKLANAARNGVSLAELMGAAGYLGSMRADHLYTGNTNAEPDKLQEWEKVIEEAARYQISPELAADLIRSLGQSLEKMKK